MAVARPALEALRWLAGCWLLSSVPRCGAGGDAPEAGGRDVSVVVPARDEEATLPVLLASLADQVPPPAEVVVADDGSRDGTAAVARAWGATVVPCPPLPPGWAGKPWACWTGAAATTRPTLVFLDADTELAPGGLARLLGEQHRRGGLVSVQPFHDTRRPHEALSALFNVVAMMGVDAFSPARRWLPPAGAFGACLACARSDYQAAGGHRAVRGEVLEDMALARRFLATGLPVSCLGGRGTISFRMYPRGVGQVVEGWSKNFAAGAAATRPVTFVLVCAWISGCVSAAWRGAWAAVGRGSPAPVPAVASYLAYAAQLRWMLARVGRFSIWAAALFPVPLSFFLAVFTRSLALTFVRRRVRWRGRYIPLRGGPGRRRAG